MRINLVFTITDQRPHFPATPIRTSNATNLRHSCPTLPPLLHRADDGLEIAPRLHPVQPSYTLENATLCSKI
jgi:hypothetical protein